MPIIFGILGKTVKAEGITSPAGLVSFLAKQSSFLKNLLPAGLEYFLYYEFKRSRKKLQRPQPTLTEERSGGLLLSDSTRGNHCHCFFYWVGGF